MKRIGVANLRFSQFVVQYTKAKIAFAFLLSFLGT